MFKIDNTKLYGILNELDGTPIRRKVRSLKVGIGLPKGPDVHVWIDVNGKYCLGVGKYEGGNGAPQKRIVDTQRFDTREEIRAAYLDARRKAPVRPYPVKLPYFTFLRIGLEGEYVHDLDVIFEHGSMPTEVDVVFLAEDPLDAKFQYFTAQGLHCEGNGLNARRRVTMAERPGAPDEEKRLAEEAIEHGERWYPIEEGCFARGCPFGNSSDPRRPPVCKPHGRLHFHLINSPTIGSTTTFDTTGKRSINQLQTCLDELSNATKKAFPPDGTVVGIPLTLRVAPYRVQRPDGAPTVQHAVSLEARGKNAVVLWQTMLSSAAQMHDLIEGGDLAPRQLKAAPQVTEAERPVEVPASEVAITDEIAAGEPDLSAADEAAAVAGEFYVDGQEEDQDEEGGFTDAPATTATPEQTKPETGQVRSIGDLTSRLKQKTEAKPEPETKPATTETVETSESATGEPAEAEDVRRLKSVPPQGSPLEQELAACGFVADVNRIRERVTGPESQLSADEKSNAAALCEERIKALRAAKRAKANGNKSVDNA